MVWSSEHNDNNKNTKNLQQLTPLISILVLFLFLTGCSNNLYTQKPAFYSYIIGYTKGNRITAEHASKVYTTPASCQKVITALVALKELGPHYTYKTKLFISNQNVIISFSGDPTLTSNDLELLLAPLKNKRIKGKIILDASAFQASPHSPYLIIDDIGKNYASPVSSINIDHNLISLKVVPSIISNPLVISDVKYKIISTITNSKKLSSIKVSWDRDTIVLTGNINIDEVHKFQISPNQIKPFVIEKIKAIVDKLGIKGKIEMTTKTHNYGNLINQINSKPLKQILEPALKKSDNLVFDSLYLTMLKIKDWRYGSNAITKLIQKHYGLNFNHAVIVDGSGLSRYNQIQPSKLFALLKKSHDLSEFINLLPYPKEDNTTLSNRINLPNYIKAKTGNMQGISCLCGYSKLKTFVIMTNSFSSPSSNIFKIMDKFLFKHLNN